MPVESAALRGGSKKQEPAEVIGADTSSGAVGILGL